MLTIPNPKADRLLFRYSQQPLRRFIFLSLVVGFAWLLPVVSFAGDGEPPFVVILTPQQNEEVSGTVLVEANATDNVGVDRVEFVIEEQVVGSDTTPPYTYSWDTVSICNGVRTIQAVAHDASGNNSQHTITANVNNTPSIEDPAMPPFVRTTNPQDNDPVTGFVFVTVVSTDNACVVRVELDVDGSLRDIDHTAPYQFWWNTLMEIEGPHTLTARSVDPSGNINSHIITVNVGRDSDPPTIPTGFTGTPAPSQVTLMWNPNPEPDLFYYQLRGSSVGFNGPYLFDVILPTVTVNYLHSRLINGVTYYYELMAGDSSLNLSNPAQVSARPRDGAAPSPPQNFVAAPVNARVDLSWSQNTEPDLFQYRLRGSSIGFNGPYLLDARMDRLTTNFPHTPLANGVTYFYLLTAIDTSDNESGPSQASARPTNSNRPNPPLNFQATPSDQQLTLSWDPNEEPDIFQYHLLGSAVGFDGPYILDQTFPPTTLLYPHTGLTNGATYYYRLTAINTSGLVSLPAQRSARPRDSSIPATPANFTATGRDGQVDLFWNANTELDLRNYRLRGSTVGFNGPYLLDIQLAPTFTSYSHSPVANGVMHYYQLVAIDTSDNQSLPAQAQAQPRDSQAPQTPRNFLATPGDEQANLAWQANTESDMDHYRLQSSSVSFSGPYLLDINLPLLPTSRLHTGLTNGVSYYYRLMAVDRTGNESGAATAIAQPRSLLPPSTPVGLTTTAGDLQVTLRWFPNSNAESVQHYLIYRATAQAGVYMVIASVAHPGESYINNTNLINGNLYWYRISAVNIRNNESALSAPVSARPEPNASAQPPQIPANLTLSPGDQQNRLRWTPNPPSNNTNRYNIYRALSSQGPFLRLAAADAATPAYLDQNLVNGQAYFYRISAVDNLNHESGLSSVVSGTPMASPPSLPEAPSGLTARAGDRKVELEWDPLGRPNLLGYFVYMSLTPQGPFGRVGPLVQESSFTAEGLTNSQNYFFTVSAVVSGSIEGPQFQPPVRAIPSNPPGNTQTPTGLVAIGEDQRVRLIWNQNSDASHYIVHMFDPQLQRSRRVASVSHPITTYVRTQLTNGTRYYFSVSAVSPELNESPATPLVEATPQVRDSPPNPVPPVPPIDVAPNPWIRRLGHGPMTFKNYRPGSQIRIYTANGALVKELPVDGNGEAAWNITNLDSEPVASDIYIAVDGSDNVTTVGVVQ